MRFKRFIKSSHLLFFAFILFISLLPFKFASAVTDDLFMSEYIEGSSNNKAIEIFNGTGSTVDLLAGSYSIRMYFNGRSTVDTTIYLTGTVAPGDVYVVTQSSANAAILAQADQVSTSVGWFNGNDAVVLMKGTEVIDSIGQVGVDPGTEWGSGLTSTADNTLVRKRTVSAGDKIINDSFDPSSEWTGFAQNTTVYLGAHDIGTYTVTYHSNGGTAIDSEVVIVNTAAQRPTDPTRTGYLFDKWYPDSGLTSEYNFSAPVTANLDLYAKWSAPIEFSITYVMNYGTNHATNPETYTVTSGLITLADPVRNGYTFTGWTPSGSIPAGSTGNKEFTATWSAPVEYTITYEMNGGVNHSSNPEFYTVDSGLITLADPTRAGYVFTGWTPSGSISAGSTGNKEFTATWSNSEEPTPTPSDPIVPKTGDNNHVGTLFAALGFSVILLFGAGWWIRREKRSMGSS